MLDRHSDSPYSIRSGSFSNDPFLFLLLRLLFVHVGSANGCGREHARSRHMYRASIAGVGDDPARLCGMCEVRAEGVLAVPLTKVALPPDAGTDPDSDNSDNHNDEENDPLIMR